MMGNLSIHCQWESAQHEPLEIRQTSAMLKIMLGEGIVTRNEDEWSRTIRDETRLSAYPLALWLVSSWWRLRWEPEPLPMMVPSQSWRMAHELGASGYGYVWPRVAFASDGEMVHAWTVPSTPNSKEVVRYFPSVTHHAMAGGIFERSIDEFIAGVIARLDAVKVEHTTLHNLWKEILEERSHTTLTNHRRLEAMLGFDPDECPDDLLQRFVELTPQAGFSAVTEMAPVCASSDPAPVLEQVISFASSGGFSGRIQSFHQSKVAKAGDTAPAWRRGQHLAQQARLSLGLREDSLSDQILCDLMGLRSQAVQGVQMDSRPLVGIAIREGNSGGLKFLLRKRNTSGRRFELARLYGDYLMAEESDRWLLETDAKTARQKAQRAFAAEFLCPINALKNDLSGDFSQEAIDEVAGRFGVGSKAVETQLVNNNLLPVDVLDDGHGDSYLPFFMRST